MELDEGKTSVIAIAIIVAVGIAYMGWLVVTYLEQRETGAYIRHTLDDFLDEFRERTAVKAEVIADEPGND